MPSCASARGRALSITTSADASSAASSAASRASAKSSTALRLRAFSSAKKLAAPARSPSLARRALARDQAAPLDLDHVRARVGEQLGAQGSRPERGEVEHARRPPRRVRTRPARMSAQPARGGRRRGRRGRKGEPEPARALGEPRERPPRDLALCELPLIPDRPGPLRARRAARAGRPRVRARAPPIRRRRAAADRLPPGDVRPRRASPNSAARSASRRGRIHGRVRAERGERASDAVRARGERAARHARERLGPARERHRSALGPRERGMRSAGPGSERTLTPRSASSRRA